MDIKKIIAIFLFLTPINLSGIDIGTLSLFQKYILSRIGIVDYYMLFQSYIAYNHYQEIKKMFYGSEKPHRYENLNINQYRCKDSNQRQYSNMEKFDKAFIISIYSCFISAYLKHKANKTYNSAKYYYDTLLKIKKFLLTPPQIRKTRRSNTKKLNQNTIQEKSAKDSTENSSNPINKINIKLDRSSRLLGSLITLSASAIFGAIFIESMKLVTKEQKTQLFDMQKSWKDQFNDLCTLHDKTIVGLCGGTSGFISVLLFAITFISPKEPASKTPDKETDKEQHSIKQDEQATISTDDDKETNSIIEPTI